MQVRSGYLQVDNCIMEDGMVYVQNPGSISAHFCTFRHATLILQHVNASIIQNCEFSQTDSAAITVEGYPKDEKNWTYQSMVSKMMSLCRLQQPERQKSGETMHKSAFSTVFSLSTATTNKKSANKKKWDDLESKASEVRNLFEYKQSCDFDAESHDIETHSCDASLVTKSELIHGAVGGEDDKDFRNSGLVHTLDDFESGNQSQSVLSLSLPYSSSEIVIEDNTEHSQYRVPGSKSFTKLPDIFESQKESSSTEEDGSKIKSNREKLNRIQNFVSDCAKYSNSAEEGNENIITESDQLNSNGTLLKHTESGKSNFLPNGLVTDQETNASKHVNQSTDNGIEDDKDVEIPSLNLHSLERNMAENQGNSIAQSRDSGAEEESMSASTISLVQSASSDDTGEEEEGAAGRAYGSGRVNPFPNTLF